MTFEPHPLGHFPLIDSIDQQPLARFRHIIKRRALVGPPRGELSLNLNCIFRLLRGSEANR